MLKVNKIIYIVLAVICTVFALGTVISKICVGQTFDFATDGMLLLTTVAGWVFVKKDDNSKSDPPQGGSTDEDDGSDDNKE